MSDRYECWRLEDIPEDMEEMRRGYHGGRADDPEPGPNHSPAYRHGWWAGQSDAFPDRRPAWLMPLVRLWVQDRRKQRAQRLR